MKSMPREPAMRGAFLDWDRGLCKEGCKEWIPCRTRRAKRSMAVGLV